jgi:hypothetical protein
MKKMIWWIIGLIMLLSGTAITTIITMNSNRESYIKSDKMLTLSQENKTLNDSIKIVTNENQQLGLEIKAEQEKNKQLIIKNLILSEENVEISKKNIQLSNELNFKTQELSNYMTGGKGVCFIRFFDVGNKKSSAGFKNLSKYPIYINEVTILDLDCIEKSVYTTTINGIQNVKVLDLDAHERCSRKIGPLELPSGNQITLWDDATPAIGYPTKFLVNFQTRTGTFNQKIVVTQKEDKILFAFQIVKEDKIIYEEFDSGINKEEIDFEIVKMPEVILRKRK